MSSGSGIPGPTVGSRSAPAIFARCQSLLSNWSSISRRWRHADYLTRFLDANRYPLRSKTLARAAGLSAGVLQLSLPTIEPSLPPPFNNSAVSRSLSRDLLKRVEAGLLLGGQAGVEVVQRRLDLVRRLQHGREPLLHRL